MKKLSLIAGFTFTFIASTSFAINSDKSIPFTFKQPAQMVVKDLPGRGVLAIYVNTGSSTVL